MAKKTVQKRKRKFSFVRKTAGAIVASGNIQNRPLSYLAIMLKSPDFFSGMEKLPERSDVGKIVFNGIPLVIKNTLRQKSQGFDFKKMRKIFLAHQLAVRKKKINPKHYRLRSIKVFGRIGHFLVMRFVEGKGVFSQLKQLDSLRASSLLVALGELEKNLLMCRAGGREKIPQVSDLIVAGNTEPHHPEIGKWTFYLPYDYY